MKFPIQILLFLSFFHVLTSQEIGVDIMPASHYIMNKQDMQRLRDEINHDLRRRISNIEESWQANEAIREVSSGVWNMQGSTYPALYNTNGLGGLGQQAMRSYWENYAKAVDPLNYKRKMESQAEETHAESTSDKIEEQMTNMNEKINNLKTSIKKSNEAAQAKVDTERPQVPVMPKNEENKDQGAEASLEQKIVNDNKENPTANPNEKQVDMSNSGGATNTNENNKETKNTENNKGNEAAGKNEEASNKNGEASNKNEEASNKNGEAKENSGNEAASKNEESSSKNEEASNKKEEASNKNEAAKENSGEQEKKQEESAKSDENKGAEQEKTAQQSTQEENKGEVAANKNEGAKENSGEQEKKQEESAKIDESKGAEQEKTAQQSTQEENKGTMRFLQHRPKQETLNGPLQSGFTIYKELYDK